MKKSKKHITIIMLIGLTLSSCKSIKKINYNTAVETHQEELSAIYREEINADIITENREITDRENVQDD